MQNGYKYDEGDSAYSGSGITLKASEPLSPNAFVQIPAEPYQTQSAVFTPVSRQKKMRVPHGGSVERPLQRVPRRAAKSVQLEEPERTNTTLPSLHILLESEPEEPGQREEEPDSLAQFVAGFPRIPDRLIFQSDGGRESAERSQAKREEETPSSSSQAEHRGWEGQESEHEDPFLQEDPLTIKLDEGALPSSQEASYDYRDLPSDRQADMSDHAVPANPRFEKMIRDAVTAKPSSQAYESRKSGTLASGRAQTNATVSRDLDAQRTQVLSGSHGGRGPFHPASSLPNQGERLRSRVGVAHSGSLRPGGEPAAGAVRSGATAAGVTKAGSVAGAYRTPLQGGAARSSHAGFASSKAYGASASSQEAFGRNSGPLPSRSSIASPYGTPARPGVSTGMQGQPTSRGSLDGSTGASPSRGADAGRQMPPQGAYPRPSMPNYPSASSPSSNVPRSTLSGVPSPAPSPVAAPVAAPMAEPEGSQAPSTGKPLLDSAALEESTIFDEPPISIAEGMKDADKSHQKGRKLIMIGIVVVILALIGGFFFFGSRGSITIPEITITTTNPNASNESSGNSSAADNAGPTQESVAGANASAGGAGSVTYRYTAKTPAGIEYSVEESTTFDDQGKCTFTTMKMQFPSEQAAKEYTDSVARDLGSKYTLDSLNGANATVTIDNSGLGLNREDYENALRYSVDDLVILKK